MTELHVTNYGGSEGVLRTVGFGAFDHSVRILIEIAPQEEEGEFDIDITSDLPVESEDVPESLTEVLSLVTEYVSSEEFASGWKAEAEKEAERA